MSHTCIICHYLTSSRYIIFSLSTLDCIWQGRRNRYFDTLNILYPCQEHNRFHGTNNTINMYCFHYNFLIFKHWRRTTTKTLLSITHFLFLLIICSNQHRNHYPHNNSHHNIVLELNVLVICWPRKILLPDILGVRRRGVGQMEYEGPNRSKRVIYPCWRMLSEEKGRKWQKVRREGS